MAITAEVYAQEVVVVDTDRGILARIPIATSVTITERQASLISVVTATTDATLNFGGVSAAKIVVIKTDAVGAISVKYNGGGAAITVTPLLILVDTAGGITSLTYSNASGSTVMLEALICG